MIVNDDWVSEARKLTELLKFLRGRVVTDQIFEDGQDVLPILNDLFQDGAKLRGAHGFLVPFRQNGRGNLYVAAQLFGRMSAQK